MTAELARLTAALADRYRIERELGIGGMATVYLARDLKHDRDVAIKVLHAELSAVLGAERFVREIRLTAGLQHANILPLFDSGSTEEAREGGSVRRLFYVMPYVEGETLRARLARGAVPIAEAIAILRDIARALAYAHGRPVVHRDIKPENVLLAGDAAVVADFGIAKALAASRRQGPDRAQDVTHGLTEAGTSLGTPAYMAPEQALGDAIDARSDVYAWGVVAYEVLAGAHPFAAHTTAQRLVAAHLSETPAPLAGARPDAPPDVAALVMQCLAKDPAGRPADGAEVLARLSAVATPVAADAKAVPVVARRHAVRWLVVAIAAALMLALGVRALARRSPATAPTRTVVVVPFDNIGDPADAYFADGMSEEIAGQLARLPGLQVIGRDGVQRFRGSGRSPRDIAGELGAAYVLSGSVNWARASRTAGVDGSTRVRIVPALLNVATGTQMWREPFEEPLSDVFKVQTSVAEQVASALSVTLGVTARQALRREESADPDARDAQLLGRYLLRQRGLENLRRAEAAFGRAVARDSSYARAWAGLSEAIALRPAYNDTTESIDAILGRAERAAQRAVALDSMLPEAQLALARIRSAQFRFRESLQAVDRALALDPNATLAYALKYEVLTALGRIDEAGDAARRAVELDGLSALALNNRAVWFSMARQMDSATYYTERAVAIAPDEVLWKRTRASIYASSGRLGEAIVLCEASMAPADRCRGIMAAVAGVPEHRDEALAALGALGRLPGASGTPTFAAIGYARLGMADSVFSRLRAAVERHDDTFTHLITHTAFAPFQADPRWDQIVGAVRRR